MESNRTNQNQTEWTAREYELAERLDIEPESVRLIDSIREQAEQGGRAEVTKKLRQITGLSNDPEIRNPDKKSTKTTTGISGLDRMIVKAPFGTATAIYAGIELGRSSPELGARIQAFVRGSLPEFFEQLNPEKSKDGDLWDNECDVLPAVQWLRFLDGFKAAMPSEANYDEKSQRTESDAAKSDQESIGDPNLRTIKRWIGRLTYQQKLAAILMLELLQKESEFDKPDNSIGDDLSKKWSQEIIDASGDSKYLNNADAEELAITAATAMMIPWKV